MAAAYLFLVRSYAMPRFEELMNSLTDHDWGWRPFLFLRPRKDQDMDNAVLLKMACCFGPAAGMLVLLLRFLFHRPITLSGTLIVLLGCSILFFVGYKFTFAVFWNRRARRLRAHESQFTSET